MSKLLLTSIVTLLATAAAAAEPYRLRLVDIRKNIYVETVELDGKNLTPDCPHRWSVRKYMLHGGKQHGVEVVDIHNGTMLIQIIPTRGMSVQKVVMGDLRLGWDSPVTAIVHPKFINLESRRGLGWLEGFNEWMVRCGLEFLGAPGTDKFIDNTGDTAEMELTLHGKISNIPASVLEIVVEQDHPYRITVRGMVEEACLHGPKLELWAEVSTVPGSNTFLISDTITNRSAREQEFGIIYHANYGPPLMEKDARFVAPARRIAPINTHAASDVDSYDRYRGPTPGFAEQVYCLWLWADEKDHTKVAMHNASADKAVSMGYSVGQLPFFTLWKNPVAVEDGYVTGLEPGTGFPRNRSIERKSGRVPKLPGHGKRRFVIEIGLHTTAEQVSSLIKDIERIRAGRAVSPHRLAARRRRRAVPTSKGCRPCTRCYTTSPSGPIRAR